MLARSSAIRSVLLAAAITLAAGVVITSAIALPPQRQIPILSTILLALLVDGTAKSSELAGGGIVLATFGLIEYDLYLALGLVVLHWSISSLLRIGEGPLLLLRRILVTMGVALILGFVQSVVPLEFDTVTRVLTASLILCLLDPTLSAVLRVVCSGAPLGLAIESSIRRLPATGAFVSVGGLGVLLGERLGLLGGVVVACLALVVAYSLHQFSLIQQAYLDTIEAVVGLAKVERADYAEHSDRIRRRAEAVGLRLGLGIRETRSLGLAAVICSTKVVDGELEAVDLMKEAFEPSGWLRVHPDASIAEEVIKVAVAVRSRTVRGAGGAGLRVRLFAYVVTRVLEVEGIRSSDWGYWNDSLGDSVRHRVDAILGDLSWLS